MLQFLAKMNIKKSIDLVEIIIDEIALEGLDGITLEALWQRLAIRLGETLPLKDAFMEQIWKICLELHGFTFFELENAREALIIFDRYELEYMGSEVDKEYDQKDIYPHCPVEDVELGIKGSCSTYYSRKDISNVVKNLTLPNVSVKYGQKLVIVASQTLRENALIDGRVSPIFQLSLALYCLLERIGRTRKIGEISINKSVHIKENAKTLFYMRKALLTQGMIRKQVYYQGNTGAAYNGQNMGTLIHLTRFYNVRRPKVIIWAEHLIDYLKSKENYAAEYNEVKNELNLDYSIKKFFKIQMLQKVFRTDLKVPYRSYYTNSSEKEWHVKANPNRERILKLVTLTDPNIEITDIWRTEECNEELDFCQLDTRNHKFGSHFLKQVYQFIRTKETKGLSQSELAAGMGLPKLMARTLIRNIEKSNTAAFYVDDVGRQRTKKYVSKEFDSQSSRKIQLKKEINKMIQHGSSIKNSIKSTDERCTSRSNKFFAQKSSEPKPKLYNDGQSSHLLASANNILRKYKITKCRNRYRHTSSTNTKKPLKIGHLQRSKSHDKSSVRERKGVNTVQQDGGIHDSDFYKMIETELIVQKPECKKKSQKMAVVGLMNDVQDPDNMQSKLSFRMIRRANLILDSVKEHKIIEDTQKLMKYINKQEDAEGLGVKMDKNSLIRLLQRLSKDNLIKYIKLVLRNERRTKQRIITFICDPSVKEDDAVIQSAIEQAKLKFCMLETNLLNSTDGEKKPSALDDSTFEDEKLIIYRNDSLGKKYGYCPKFKRLQTMHIFLYYLIYDHSKKPESKDELFENLRSEGHLLDYQLGDDMEVYSKKVDWKMFIPPLPRHGGYTPGWALIRDILLRMPLSIFVQVHNVNFEVPGLQKYLDHPVKKHYLLKDIPSAIRNLLFFRRKYLFSVHDLVTRLCYLGLVQFGPQLLKEKDQVFIYLNRRSELLDTTSSAAGYHNIEDKAYPVSKFYFASMSDVEKYWCTMWHTCINTDLGGRSVVEGKDILLEDLPRKPEMIEATKVKAVGEAEKDDTGFVPGDRKGAAGIDSAFFSHLKRNWTWVSTSQQSQAKKPNWPVQKINLAKVTIRHRVSQPRKLLHQKPAKKRAGPVKQSQEKSSPSKSSDKATGKAKRHVPLTLSFVQSSKPAKVIRKVLPRKRSIRKRVKYDEVDIDALKRMHKLRVDWKQHEDIILLVCKVAMAYLSSNSRRNPVTFPMIRDVLRSYSFTSYNKTSRACQRRLLYMLKQSKTSDSVRQGVEEIKEDYYFNKRFGKSIEQLKSERKNTAAYENNVREIFKELVAYIAKKHYSLSNTEHRVLPKTIQEFNIFHNVKSFDKTISSSSISKEPRSIDDIHTSAINSVIHSSMCCSKDHNSWAFQLFNVYRQYSDPLLGKVLMKIRADQMVAMKKNYLAEKRRGQCMPMSSSQYQLSSAYYYKFQTKWPYEIFSESYEMLKSLLENYVERQNKEVDGVEVKPGLGGVVAAIYDFLSTGNIDISIEIPDQILMLDPGLPEKDEVYQRIADRYQSILRGLDSGVVDQTNDISIENVEPNIASQAGEDDEQQSFVAVRSAKRPIEQDNHTPEPEPKRQKVDDEQINLPLENNQSKVDAKVESRQEKTKLVDNELTKTSSQEENVSSNEPMVIDCCEEQNLERLVFNDQSWTHHLLELQPGAENVSDTNPSTSAIEIDDTNQYSQSFGESHSSTLSKMHSAFDDVPNEGDLGPSKNKDSFIKVNELVKNVANWEAMEDLESRIEVQDVRTRQTRIAMLTMREELQDLTFQDSHHAHEYFVVNSCKLSSSLKTDDEHAKDLTMYNDLQLPKALLPMDIKAADKILEDIKKLAIFPQNPIPYRNFKAEMLANESYDWNEVDSVCMFIESKKQLGASLQEIVTNFGHLKNTLADILLLLSEKQIVLRTGVIVVRYIYQRYASPWLIHSSKILRREKESHPPLPHGSVYMLDSRESTADKELEDKRVTTAENLFYSSPVKALNVAKNSDMSDASPLVSSNDNAKENTDNSEEMEASTVADNENLIQAGNSENTKDENVEDDSGIGESPKKLLRKRTMMLKQKEINRSKKLLDFKTAEDIKVVIKPWIRIDGVLNRRVLDRMLGAVLCYCYEKPGTSLSNIQNRFAPALQPYHTRELIEILARLDCVKMSVQERSKVTLFSKPSKLDMTGNPDLSADSDAVFIEPTIQSTLKFGMFLSNRSYNSDFLSNL